MYASTKCLRFFSISLQQETLERVKKCKNFLVTLIKLASSDSRSANNVRGLVRSLLEGKMEAEEFTELLYDELKSTPQPCLVPFLKVSLPPRPGSQKVTRVVLKDLLVCMEQEPVLRHSLTFYQSMLFMV
ncbi:Transcription initiation factor TFIID subunit 4 [Oryzias melastigma]|uniref:Transcription initiation factor TFIID subunit 4 n=1 Tax=Oryzias melastigma TaxID=30732 RepID=A0A834CTT2_ORYME|nr:Transcription initiation factor TFIID subunit 4 [Oryzias melastigma]